MRRTGTRGVTWLTSLPAGVLVVGWLLAALALAVASRAAIPALVPVSERDHVQGIAAPLMPALGATFAILTALTLASEASFLRSAQDTVSGEAAAASRLAWAATSPGVDSRPVHAALRSYLVASHAHEWRGTGWTNDSDPATTNALADLERAVRASAARQGLPTPIGTELLTSLDAVSSGRRARMAAASQQLPVLYFVAIVAAGAALIANAAALTIRSSARTSVLIVGLAVVIGLSMALLFALTGPWEGPLAVSGRPLDTIVANLRQGFFHS